MRDNHRIDGDSTAANIFGGALKRHRQRLAWSQEDLAEASGVAARTISDLERGVAQQPRSSTVRMLAEALGLSGADLAAFKAAARGSREPPRGSGGVVRVFAVEGMTLVILDNAQSRAQVEPLLLLAALLAGRRALTTGDVLAELRVEYRRLGHLAAECARQRLALSGEARRGRRTGAVGATSRCRRC